jgi:hypothetical protein
MLRNRKSRYAGANLGHPAIVDGVETVREGKVRGFLAWKR